MVDSFLGEAQLLGERGLSIGWLLSDKNDLVGFLVATEVADSLSVAGQLEPVPLGQEAHAPVIKPIPIRSKASYAIHNKEQCHRKKENMFLWVFSHNFFLRHGIDL
jgi:hypothetical protein